MKLVPKRYSSSRGGGGHLLNIVFVTTQPPNPTGLQRTVVVFIVSWKDRE